MTEVTFLGGEDCGNVGHTDWTDNRGGSIRFPVNQPVDLNPNDPQHAHIIKKARINRFFEVSGPEPATDMIVTVIGERGGGGGGSGGQSGEDDAGVSEEVKALRAEATELGVRGANLFKCPDKLRQKIAEAKAE